MPPKKSPSEAFAALLYGCAAPFLAASRSGEIETFTAVAGCLSCGGDVRYPWFDGMPKDNGLGYIGDTGHCINCVTVRLIVSRDGYVHRWMQPEVNPFESPS